MVSPQIIDEYLTNINGQLIRDLHIATAADGEDQAQKGTQLLEIYALEIQMYNEMKNHKKLKVCHGSPSC